MLSRLEWLPDRDFPQAVSGPGRAAGFTLIAAAAAIAALFYLRLAIGVPADFVYM